MSRTIHVSLRYTIAIAAGAACLLFSEQALLRDSGHLTSAAEARIGRPLTPMSYAGVARRTTRRAVAVGVGAAAVGTAAAVAATPRCVQAVDAYGRLYTRCY